MSASDRLGSQSLRVVAVAQYPPIEGIPTADGPINHAIARYASQYGSDVQWVFSRDPQGRSAWADDLARFGIRASRAEWSAKAVICSMERMIKATCQIRDPRRVMLVAKEAGILWAGVESAVEGHQPHLVYLASPYAALLASGPWNVPIVYNSMDSLVSAFDNGSYGRREGLRASMRRSLMHRFDRVACANKALTMFVTEQDAASAPYADRTAVASNGADIDRFQSARPEEKAAIPTLVFQGSPRYLPNLRAMEVIVHEIAPYVWSAFPEAVFQFFGSGSEGLSASLAGGDSRLQFVGYVDDLGAALRRAWIVLAPLEDGAGIKNKVLDAAASGVPCVGLPEAFTGMNNPGGSIQVATRAEVAPAVVELLKDEERRAELGIAARHYAESVAWPSQVGLYVQAWRSVVRSTPAGLYD